ncbi:MAG: NUDIX domain-containing protein [Oscillospiraceae bacterium]|nr:NUDIX domain-containing protein [Oscillospiraceae bacterium]
MALKREKSCGALVFRKTASNSKEILMIRHYLSSNWCFPKGHIEVGESEKETATREVKEETGINIEIIHDFRHEIKYAVKSGVEKKVVYFVAVDHQKQSIGSVDQRIERILWVNIKRAYDRLKFPNDRNLLIAAIEYLKSCKEMF